MEVFFYEKVNFVKGILHTKTALLYLYFLHK